eukprot:NODE_714_length_4847_cov_0.370893.p1 type:complete len:300 gc:universal NODE_714_length_4847_cov_0.370893:1277-2176(+)
MTIGVFPEEKEIDFNEILNNTPLFMKDLPDNLEEFPELEALQSLAFDGSPSEIFENFKSQGNMHYNAKNYKEAIKFYNKGLSGDITTDMKIVLMSNISQCHLLLHNFRKCYLICMNILQLDRKSEKAYYRALQALLRCERYEESYEIAKVANKFCPSPFFAKTIKDCLKKKILKEKEELRVKAISDAKDLLITDILSRLQSLSVITLGDLKNCPNIPVFDGDELLVPVIVKVYPESVLFEKVELEASIKDLVDILNVSGEIYADVDASGSRIKLSADARIIDALRMANLVGGCLCLSIE